jgi:hypothetical protein
MPVQFYLTAVNFVSMHVILVNILRGNVCLPKLKVYLLTYLLTMLCMIMKRDLPTWTTVQRSLLELWSLQLAELSISKDSKFTRIGVTDEKSKCSTCLTQIIHQTLQIDLIHISGRLFDQSVCFITSI